MATDSQINANSENAQHSTGPRTASGKAISARNALTLGLFTRSDYVREDEQAEYDELCVRCVTELNPAGVLEETFLAAIVSATWRLRRCALLENQLTCVSDLDPMCDQHSGRIQNSIDRARSQAFNRLHRSTAEVRRLQTDRAIATRLGTELAIADSDAPLAGPRQVVTAIDLFRSAQHRRSIAKTGQDLSPQNATAHQNQWSSGSFCSGSQQVRPYPHDNRAQTPRSGRCPCGSGEKFKRCCGRTSPPVLSPAGKGAPTVMPYPRNGGTKPENPGQSSGKVA